MAGAVTEAASSIWRPEPMARGQRRPLHRIRSSTSRTRPRRRVDIARPGGEPAALATTPADPVTRAPGGADPKSP
jgi:hypothetical protein